MQSLQQRHAAPRLQPARSPLLRPLQKHASKRSTAVAAAPGAGGRADPYKVRQLRPSAAARTQQAGQVTPAPPAARAQVLGLEAEADNNAVNRAYRVKRYEARGNEPLLAEIEAAHSQLMFSSLSARLKVSAATRAHRWCSPALLQPGRDRHAQQHLSAAAAGPSPASARRARPRSPATSSMRTGSSSSPGGPSEQRPGRPPARCAAALATRTRRPPAGPPPGCATFTDRPGSRAQLRWRARPAAAGAGTPPPR
jgi:hypothetical protein